jgi:hypothetical protein
MNPDLLDADQSKVVHERADDVRADFPNKFNWAAGLGVGSLRHMAELVGLACDLLEWIADDARHCGLN